jgi:hypothetical protein
MSPKISIQLSIIVPVYNEEKTIGAVLEKLLALKFVHEIIVVDDGSSDQTASIIKKFVTKHPQHLTFISQTNQGKGAAVRAGINQVTGNYLLIQDADLEYDPQDIPLLLKPVQDGKAQVVYGSRFLGPHTNLLFWHMVGNQFLNFLTNLLYNTTLSDLETCYKLLPVSLVRELQLRENDFRIEPEITCKILRKGIRIFETPISYTGRDFSEGKKISWRDGFGALWTILQLRIGL